MSEPSERPEDIPTGRYDEAAVARARLLLDKPPEQIGPYRILERIGVGGMGDVFRAEQRTPIRREVAIKSIKLGMDTRAVIARFEAERQALALMDHPHIARVLDAGTDDTGRPYFVMEYVKGKPITDYADQNKLTIAERLDLFEQVCHAIQHAHHKGIIHRDLKPSNVLVSTQDGKPFAKVIDFGIAKAVSQTLTDKTLFTRHDQFIGTPQYMSPEQAEGSLDIDTRTDVYSLGVLLYELLAGSPPFSTTDAKAAAFEQFKKLIIEVDPPPPSSRISQSTDTLPCLAAVRRVEPKRLSPIVRGELDWIVMKALEKDRKRRYETPNNLAGDLQAHLRGEPVEAAPPSTAYRLRKFLRRNQGPVTIAATALLAVLIGLLGCVWGLRQALLAEAQTAAVNSHLENYAGKLQDGAARWYAETKLQEGMPAYFQNNNDEKSTSTLELPGGFRVRAEYRGQEVTDVKNWIDDRANPDQARLEFAEFFSDSLLRTYRSYIEASKSLAMARDDAERRLAELTIARGQSDALLYRSGIQLAYDMLTKGQIVEARETLNALPETQRGWEWLWLKAEVTGMLDDFTLPEDDIFVAHSKSGRYAVVRKRDEPQGPFRLFNAFTHQLSDPLEFPVYEKCFGVAVSDTGRVAIFAVHPFSQEIGERSSLHVWDPMAGRVIWSAASGRKTHHYLFVGLEAMQGSLRITPDGTRVAANVYDYKREPVDSAKWDRLLTGNSFSYNCYFVYDLSDNSAKHTVIDKFFPSDDRACDTVLANWQKALLCDLRNGKLIPVNIESQSQGSRARPVVPPLIYNNYNSDTSYLVDPDTGTSLASISRSDGERVLASDRDATVVLADRDSRLWLRNIPTGLELKLCYSFTSSYVGYDSDSHSFIVYDDLSNRSMFRVPCLSLEEMHLLAETSPDNARWVGGGLETSGYGDYRVRRTEESLQAIGTSINTVGTYRSPDSAMFCAYEAVSGQDHDLVRCHSIDSPDVKVSIPVSRDWKPRFMEWGSSRRTAALFVPHDGDDLDTRLWGLWVVDLAQSRWSGPQTVNAGRKLSILGIHEGIVWIHSLDSVRGFRLADLSEVTGGVPIRAERAAVSADGTLLAVVSGRTISVLQLPKLVIQSQFQSPFEYGWLEWTPSGERLIVASEYPDSAIICDPIQGRVLLSLAGYQWRETASPGNHSIGLRVPFRNRWPLIQATARDEFNPEQQLSIVEKVLTFSGRVATAFELAETVVQHPTLIPTQKAIALRLIADTNKVFGQLDHGRAWIERADAEKAVKAIMASNIHPPAVKRLLEVFPRFWNSPSADKMNTRAWDVVKSPSLAATAYQSALRAAKACNRAEPDKPSYVNTLGVALYRAGQFREAVDALERSERLAQAEGTSFPSNALFIGMAKFRLRDFDGAAEAIRPIAAADRKLDVEDAKFLLEALDVLALIELDRGRPVEAITAWNRVSLAQPENTYLRLRIATVCAWYQLDAELKAIRVDSIAFGEKTDVVDQKERSAKVCCFSENPDRAQLERARLCLKAALEQAPTHRYANYFHLALGMAEYRLGNYSAAWLEWEVLKPTALRDTDDFVATVGFYRAMTQARLGRIQEARVWQTQAMQKMRPIPAAGQNPLGNNANADHIISWLASRECAQLLDAKAE